MPAIDVLIRRAPATFTPNPNTAVIVGLYHVEGYPDTVARATYVDNGEPAIGVDKVNLEFLISNTTWDDPSAVWLSTLTGAITIGPADPSKAMPLIVHSNVIVRIP